MTTPPTTTATPGNLETSRVFIVSAPSGTGKTTLNRRLLREHAQVQMSVSYTARQRRPQETDGVDYHFVTPDAFRERIRRGEMLEWAEVFGTLYGTSLAELRRILGLGRTPILEIDVQGWSQARQRLGNACAVFILPPSVESLWDRLAKRGTEPEAVRYRRLMTARSEISSGHLYDYFVVNADVEEAYAELKDIVINGKKGRIDNAAGTALCKRLLGEFDSAPWLAKLSAELADKNRGS
jgi:guanylate kinase